MDIELNQAVEGAKIPPDGGFLAFAEPLIELCGKGKTEVENAATFEDGYRIQRARRGARIERDGCAVNRLLTAAARRREE